MGSFNEKRNKSFSGSSRRDSRGGSRFNRGNRRDFSGSRRDSFKGRGSREKEMFEVICDKCQKPCKVPFKPTSSKPVLCSECYEKSGNSSSSRSTNYENYNEQFKKVNEKIDQLIDLVKNKL